MLQSSLFIVKGGNLYLWNAGGRKSFVVMDWNCRYQCKIMNIYVYICQYIFLYIYIYSHISGCVCVKFIALTTEMTKMQWDTSSSKQTVLLINVNNSSTRIGKYKMYLNMRYWKWGCAQKLIGLENCLGDPNQK